LLLVNALAVLLLLPSLNAFTTASGTPARGALLASLWGSVLFSPVMAVIKAMLFTGIVWAVAAVWDRPVAIDAALRPALVAELALALGGPWAGIVLLARGGASVAGDLAVPTGIDAFWSVPAGWPTILAEQFGLFHLLWAIVFATLLHRVFRSSRPAMVAAVAACWLTSLGGALIRANLIA
jgi:hypothetical protein